MNQQKSEARKHVGPGKTPISLYADTAFLKDIDARAAQLRMSRSRYFEWLAERDMGRNTVEPAAPASSPQVEWKGAPTLPTRADLNSLNAQKQALTRQQAKRRSK